MYWTTYFRNKHYINLDHRLDRNTHILNEFRKLGINVSRFPGLVFEDKGPYRNPGTRGCAESHLALIRLAQSSNWPNIFIFEDDAYFSVDFNEIMNSAIQELRYKPWDLFFCYVHNTCLDRICSTSAHLRHIKGTYNLHAYAVNRKFYSTYLQLYTSNLNIECNEIKLMNSGAVAYATVKDIAGQIYDYSDRIGTYDKRKIQEFDIQT